MDWQTVRQQIIEEIDRPNDGELVDRAMVEALRSLRKMRLWFTEGSWSIATVSGTTQYDRPVDLIAPIGPVYYTTDPGATQTRRPLLDRTVDELEQWCGVETSGSSGSYSWTGNYLLIAPAPSQTNDTLDGRGVLDFGTPVVKFTADSGWRVFTPQTDPLIAATPLLGDWTSPWLTHGQDILRGKAKMILNQRYYDDAAAADAAINEMLEAQSALKVETNARKPKTSPRGYFS